MTPRVLSVTGHERFPILAWNVASAPAGAITEPAALTSLAWTEAPAPTTAASAFADHPRRFDADDWWFRATLPAIERTAGDELAIAFGGLATVAEVWLDGAPLLTSDNMFLAHERRVERGGGELVIACRAIDPLLAKKRPRPRWRAPMIEHQQLRWIRTTLLGRTPGWSPPTAAVGPWRPVVIERRTGIAIDDVRLRTTSDGAVDVACRVRSLDGAPFEGKLVIEGDGQIHRRPLRREGDGFVGRVEVPDPKRWWPHTHGTPTCYRARLELGTNVVDLGTIGFRDLVREGDFGFSCNGARIFCRGACWTPIDTSALGADRDATRAALVQARDAGMNMIRVGGTMVYETDDFYEACDELGILVWQDFMFANMDYPEDDAPFVAGVTEEARQILGRLQARPSVAALCGNSEGEQQAAMFGASRERWSPRLFHEVLPEVAREICPDVAYWPSSAHGGAFPHQPSTGTTSYYGVGAYLRPLDDARRSDVRFATECLAFANIPEPRALPGGPSVRVHHPAWKARTPRDLGAGWDFDDVRDHYLEELFEVDPMRLRYADHERYLALGRVVTGEVMAQVFGEWRTKRSSCGGGLVWFLRDLWTSAGWGVVDAGGAAKAPYWYLKRALQPIGVHVSDEGNNGLFVHVANELPDALDGTLELTLWRGGEVKVASATQPLRVEAHDAVEIPGASLFEGFMDLSYAFRFGPPSHDLVVAIVRRNDGVVVGEAFHFPIGLARARETDVGLTAEVHAHDEGARIVVRTRRFAQSIAVEADGFVPSDAYFHLAPGAERTLFLRRVALGAPIKGTLQPLNSDASVRIQE